MDVTATIRIRPEFPDTEILASTEESPSDHMDISYSAGVTCIFQLAPNAEARVGIDRGSHHSKHFVVAHRDLAVALHFRNQIGWCLEWIHVACICGLVGIRQAFFGFCHHVMVN